MTALLSIGFIVLALIEVVSVWARVRLLYWRKRLTLAQEYSNSLDIDDEGVERLPCGCPDLDDWLDPCPGHVWSHWHLSPIEVLREDRFCFYCGAMETRRLDEQS